VTQYFVDTNVLVYARDASEPEKQPLAAAWKAHLWHNRNGRLSMQVLQEFYQTVTRKLKPGLAPAVARAEVEDLSRWNPVAITSDVLALAWKVEDAHQISFWDALIVAAAQSIECEFLLSEDLGDGRNFDGVVVLNPFLHPAS